MKFAFNSTPKMIATAVAVLGSVLALGAYKVGAAPSGAALPVFVGVCAFLVLLFCATQIKLAFQVPGQSALPEPRERTHRQELELAMAHGMGHWSQIPTTWARPWATTSARRWTQC